MLTISGHILTLAAAMTLSGSAALSQGIGFLEGNVYAPPTLCAAMSQQATPADALQSHGGYVLAGALSGPVFQALDTPGTCVIDPDAVNQLFGRGSDLNTVMVTVSCIDDVAYPQFEQLVLEEEGEPALGGGRITVYAVGQPSDMAQELIGEYVICDEEVAPMLDDLFLRYDENAAPG